MTRLHISESLSLPVEAVTQTIVVYGGKGMGKTNFGSVFAEELYAARMRFAVLDPMGVWWGLQHGRSRDGSGLEVLILGGIHGDLPIEPSAGEVVADLVADENVSVVIDISRRSNGKAWAKGEKVRFVTTYMTRLYERQVEHRRPIMQIIDEAARYAPQKFGYGESDESKCLGAIAMVCEEGRNLGIGLTLLTQRSARLNKDVAELADVMIAFRVVGPNSVGAVLDWFGDHVAKERHKALVERLRKLPIGTALVVSPGWLDFEGAVPIRERQTFDSSATPTVGSTLQAPGRATKPDLEKYRQRMSETIEKAMQDDPKELRRKIADLERQLSRKVDPQPVQVQIPIIDSATMDRLDRFELTLMLIRDGLPGLKQTADDLIEALQQVARQSKAGQHLATAKRPSLPSRTIARDPENNKQLLHKPLSDRKPPQNNGNLPEGERKILIALAQYPKGCSRDQLSILTGYKRSSRDTYIQRLRGRGLADQEGSLVVATDDGIDALGNDFEPFPTGAALQTYWLDRLPEGERKVLEVILIAYPRAVAREEIDEETGYRRSSRDTYIQRLRARKLVEVAGRAEVKANSELFD